MHNINVNLDRLYDSILKIEEIMTKVYNGMSTLSLALLECHTDQYYCGISYYNLIQNYNFNAIIIGQQYKCLEETTKTLRSSYNKIENMENCRGFPNEDDNVEVSDFKNVCKIIGVGESEKEVDLKVDTIGLSGKINEIEGIPSAEYNEDIYIRFFEDGDGNNAISQPVVSICQNIVHNFNGLKKQIIEYLNEAVSTVADIENKGMYY